MTAGGAATGLLAGWAALAWGLLAEAVAIGGATEGEMLVMFIVDYASCVKSNVVSDLCNAKYRPVAVYL